MPLLRQHNGRRRHTTTILTAPDISSETSHCLGEAAVGFLFSFPPRTFYRTLACPDIRCRKPRNRSSILRFFRFVSEHKKQQQCWDDAYYPRDQKEFSWRSGCRSNAGHNPQCNPSVFHVGMCAERQPECSKRKKDDLP